MRKLSDELAKLSARSLAALIRGREVSPVEIVEALLGRIERLNPKLNAIVTLAPNVLELARKAEAALLRRGEVGPLHGVPLTVKDTVETAGLMTTSGSALRASHIPGKDAPAVELLKDAGAIVIGKTNVPEMAIPYECDNPLFGRTNNPHDLTKTSGGSSGGEAAAISACLSHAGLGSDLSGSIRVPAHFCGIVGLKPTAGLVPSAGHFPAVLGALAGGAVLGPMARRVEDLFLLLDVLTGQRAGESSTHEDASRVDVRGLRVASFVDEELQPITPETMLAVEAALGALKNAGLLVVEERPPCFREAIALWPELFLGESTSQLRRLYAGKEERGGRLVQAILNSTEEARPAHPSGTEDPSAERDSLRTTLGEWMKMTPLIVAPVGSVPAFEHGARKVFAGGSTLSVFRAFGYSRAANVLGLPSVSVPAGRSPEGLPIGVQIIGRPFEDRAVLSAASIVEEALGGWIQSDED